AVEISLHDALEVRHRLAIDVTGFALRRSVGLRLKRGHSENGNPVPGKWLEAIRQELIFDVGRNMFKNIQSVYGIKIAGDRRRQSVVDERGKVPVLVHALLDVGDEKRVEVDRGDVTDSLLHKSGAECVGTSDLQHVPSAFQHFGDEFISSQRKERSSRVLIPGLVDHQPQSSNAVLLLYLIEKIVLRLFCL